MFRLVEAGSKGYLPAREAAPCQRNESLKITADV